LERLGSASSRSLNASIVASEYTAHHLDFPFE
jgi:hypothetical protein